MSSNSTRLGSRYEELFVRNVLTRVSRIDFTHVSAQYHFIDDRGGDRYCDFVIQEGGGLKVAVEVDGYDKRGTGQGMTRSEFVDWQRRHASLVAQGWRVLRFANVEVRDDPARCAELLDLLLRDERSKESHRLALERRIKDLEKASEIGRPRSKVTEDRAAYHLTGTTEAPKSSSGELEDLKSALAASIQAQQLSDRERSRLGELQQLHHKSLELEKEASFMKTTIWALTVLISLLIILFFLGRPRSSDPKLYATAPAAPQTSARPTTQPTSMVAAGSSCENPIFWRTAHLHVGQTVAMHGPVQRVARREDVRGQPTFITIGRKFPSRDRIDMVIWGRHVSAFADFLAQDLEGRDVCVFSEIGESDGVIRIELEDERQIRLTDS